MKQKKVKEENWSKINNEQKKITTYKYYPNGQLKVLTKPDKTKLYWKYDALSYERSLISKGGNCAELIHYEYEYNKLGHLLSSTNCRTGRSTIRELDGLGGVLSEILENSLTNTYEYDSVGRVNKIIPMINQATFFRRVF